MLATLFLLLRGTPFIYQGQELGMTNIEMASLEDFDDVATHSQYKRALEYGLAPEQALKAVNKRSRDNSRTPMQWNTQKNARFSTSDNVWLKVNPNYPELNAEAQLTNQQSVFNYYHQLIKLRKNSVYKDVLIYGQFLPVKDKNEHILLYERQLEDKIVLVILNVTATEQEYYVDEQYQQVLINNYEDVLLDQSRKLRLRPFESIVLANYGGQL
ncbi:hypothetical protein OG9_04833 [Enterococcus faecium EnGen0005]|nr:hypothetical protein OG9_04833 [Enterococcus faecium EnGen0005]